MAKFEVTLSDQQFGEIEDLVTQDEFLNWEQATEELLSMGLSAYDTGEATDDVHIEQEMFTQTIDDQQDPAVHDDSNSEERTF
jgi:hypothetical protein